MENRDIKTVEMTRRIRDAHYERFKDRSIEERIAFYKEQARKLDEAVNTELSQRQSRSKSA